MARSKALSCAEPATPPNKALLSMLESKVMSLPFKVPATSMEVLASDKATKVAQLLESLAVRVMSPAL